MIFILDDGGKYELCINMLVEGDSPENIHAAVAEYRSELERHTQDHKRLSEVIKRQIGNAPVYNQKFRPKQFQKWTESRKEWDTRFKHEMSQAGCHPEPDLEAIITKYGFRKVKYDFVDLTGEQ